MVLIPMLTPEGDKSSVPESDLQRYLNIGWKIANEEKEVKDAVDDKDVNEVKEAADEAPEEADTVNEVIPPEAEVVSELVEELLPE